MGTVWPLARVENSSAILLRTVFENGNGKARLNYMKGKQSIRSIRSHFRPFFFVEIEPNRERKVLFICLTDVTISGKAIQPTHAAVTRTTTPTEETMMVLHLLDSISIKTDGCP